MDGFLCRKAPLPKWLHYYVFNQFRGIAFNVTITENGIECRFHSGGMWLAFWWIFGKVFNTSMIIIDYLNVTIGSPALQLKVLVIIKSSYYLYFVLVGFFFWMYRLKLKLCTWARFKWKVKLTLKIWIIFSFLKTII